MIASVLTAAGLRTGLFTSPHLHRMTERIRVDMEEISADRFTALVEELWPDVEAVEKRGDVGVVSVFELLTAMAFVEFRSVNADVQVIEVGLGGRLDATNLVTPDVAVITPISLDHTAVLGDTVPKIAFEKAGIIKPGVPVVVGNQAPAARPVIEQAAGERERSPGAHKRCGPGHNSRRLACATPGAQERYRRVQAGASPPRSSPGRQRHDRHHRPGNIRISTKVDDQSGLCRAWNFGGTVAGSRRGAHDPG